MNTRFEAWMRITGVAVMAASVALASSYISFEGPGSSMTFALGINSAGQVVGSYSVQSGMTQTTYGYIRQTDGTITTVAPEGAVYSTVTGINAAGDVAGIWEAQRGYPTYGFTRTVAGHYTTFAIAGAKIHIHHLYQFGGNDRGIVRNSAWRGAWIFQVRRRSGDGFRCSARRIPG